MKKDKCPIEAVKELMGDVDDGDNCIPLPKEIVTRISRLVGDVDVDLDAPLSQEDELS